MKIFKQASRRLKQRGFGLIEIMISVGVFAVGALALAGLHTALTQSSANAKSRTIAANIAQAEMERLHGFVALFANANNDASYADIIDTPAPVTSTVGGTVFSMTRAVAPYYWVANAFTETVPTPAPSYADFKKLTVTVGWTDPSGTPQSTVLTDVISSLSTAASGRAIAGGGKDLAPPVPYTPGQRPDVAVIDLGNERFKETLTPEPEVYSDDADAQFVMTGFEVITFAQDPSDSDGSFLRREENRVLNCECTLNAKDANVETFQPMVWTGEEYLEGNLVSKSYGTAADDRTQDPLCNVCCRDHHDPATPNTEGDHEPHKDDTGRFKYDPWNYSEAVHSHYTRNDTGALSPVTTAGENYFEACRMIRSDGFFRVVQDVNLVNLVTLPEYYLSTQEDITLYSGYVNEIVEKYMDFLMPGAYPNPVPVVGDTFALTNTVPDTTSLPEPLNASATSTPLQQQLRSRAVYIDYLTEQARSIYNCIKTPSSGCYAPPQYFSALEAVPFFEINMTHLAEWETNNIGEVTVTNERIPSKGNDLSYSRGVAEKIGTAEAEVTVTSTLLASNTGLTNTDPVSPGDEYNPPTAGRAADITISVSGSGGTGTSILVSGGYGVQGGTKINATDVVVTGFQIENDPMTGDPRLVEGGGCNYANKKYSCSFDDTGQGWIVLSNYNAEFKGDVSDNNAACVVASNVDVVAYPPSDPGTLSESTGFFFTGLTGESTVEFLIKKDNSC